MFGFLRDLYLTGFTVFYRVGGADWTPGVNSGKGVAGVALVESALLLGIVGWIDTLAGTKLLIQVPKWAAFIAFLALCAANHYPLVSCGHGTRFQREFTTLRSLRKSLLVAGFLVVLASAIAFFIFSARAHRRSLGQAANHPAAGKAGLASQLAIGHRWPGLPEPVRSAVRYHGY